MSCLGFPLLWIHCGLKVMMQFNLKSRWQTYRPLLRVYTYRENVTLLNIQAKKPISIQQHALKPCSCCVVTMKLTILKQRCLMVWLLWSLTVNPGRILTMWLQETVCKTTLSETISHHTPFPKMLTTHVSYYSICRSKILRFISYT